MPVIHTLTGDISYKSEGGVLTNISWGDKYKNEACDTLISKELLSYFNGEIKAFSITTLPKGTLFQQKVWAELMNIPYGQVVTYQDIANKINSHPRAIGMAVGKNPIPIVIPCHRVVGKNGKLTGFSGGEGVSTKKQLLNLEHVEF